MRRSMHARLLIGGALVTISMAALADNAVTTDEASLRAGPDGSYPEVAQVDPGAPIQVMGCLDDWSWCDVAVQDLRGWMYSPDITYVYQGGYVPFYAYAPAFGLPVLTFSVDAYWGRYYHDRPWYGQREEWAHRNIHPQHPPGPPPSRSAPPREVVRSEPPHGGHGELRLGSADHNRPHADEHGAARPDGKAPDDHAHTTAPPAHQPNNPPGAEHDHAPPPPHDDHPAMQARPKAPPAHEPPHEDDHPH